jgi:DNA-binding response OmpR family regulator
MLSNRKQILLVEDHEDSRDLVTLYLEEFELISTNNFDEGLRLAQQKNFDLFILDNWLPGKSGIELCRAIREFDPHTPVLFWSAAAFEHDIAEGLRAGAQAYITKPIAPDDLRRAVVQLLSTSEAHP